MSDEALVYSVAEVADVLGCGPDLVQKLIREKRIPYVDLGPRTRVIPREAFKAWLNEEAQQALTSAWHIKSA